MQIAVLCHIWEVVKFAEKDFYNSFVKINYETTTSK